MERSNYKIKARTNKLRRIKGGNKGINRHSKREEGVLLSQCFSTPIHRSKVKPLECVICVFAHKKSLVCSSLNGSLLELCIDLHDSKIARGGNACEFDL